MASGKWQYPTKKSKPLMREPTLMHSNEGILVVEPFLGSGTSAAAAWDTVRGTGDFYKTPKAQK